MTATDQSELYRLTALAMRKPGGSPAQKAIIKKLNVLRKKQGLKPIGEAVELDELSSPIPWLNKAAAKISQVRHPKGWEKVAKEYVNGMKDPEHRKHPSAWASEVAQGYRGIEARDLVNYINMLVKKGQLPKELTAEYYQLMKVCFKITGNEGENDVPLIIINGGKNIAFIRDEQFPTLHSLGMEILNKYYQRSLSIRHNM